MGVIYHGKDLFGKTDAVPGLGHVVTEFYHVSWFPLVPLEATFLPESREDDEDGIRIPFSAKSIGLAYLRAVLIVTALFAAAAAFVPRVSGSLQWTIAATAAAFAAATYVCPPFTCASRRRADELRRLVGEYEKLVRRPVGPAIPGPKAAPDFTERFLEKGQADAPGIILTFEKRPAARPNEWIDRMNRAAHFGGRVRGEIQSTGNGLAGFVEYDGHNIRLFGVDGPVPEAVLDCTVEPSHWSPEMKERARRHRHHVLCQYRGGSKDPVEQYLALFRVALGACEDGLVSVLNEEACNFTPPDVVAYFGNPESVSACRASIPPFVWTSVLKCFRPDGACWFVTKGHHVFGVPDFALLGESEFADDVAGFMHDLFLYAYRTKATMEPGQTLEWGGERCRFGPVTEYAEYLEGPAGTLVVERDAA